MLEERPRLLVVVVGVAAVDVGRLGGHRRVEVERQGRDLALLEEPIELPDDLLGPPDGERRDEEHAVALGDEADGLAEDADRLLLRLVLAAAVGRLDEDVVGVGHDRRVAEDRRVGPAEVAGEDDPRRRAAVDVDTDSRMMAEPRMWPASTKVARMPGATSNSVS